jgi:hypothetical protein
MGFKELQPKFRHASIVGKDAWRMMNFKLATP